MRSPFSSVRREEFLLRLDRGRFGPYVPSFPEKRQFLPLFYVNQRHLASGATLVVACLQPFSSLQAHPYSIFKERRRPPIRGTVQRKKVRWMYWKGFQVWRRYGGAASPST